jgi:hypothetical protein
MIKARDRISLPTRVRNEGKDLGAVKAKDERPFSSARLAGLSFRIWRAASTKWALNPGER